PFDGKVAWLGALENLVHVGGHPPDHRRDVRAVGHEATRLSEGPPHGHRGQAPLPEELRDALRVEVDHPRGDDYYSVRAPRRHGAEGGGELLRRPRLDRLERDAQGPRRRFELP